MILPTNGYGDALRRATAPIRIVVCALLVGLCALFSVAVLSPTPAHAVDCVPDASTGCITGIVKTSTGDPATGVALALVTVPGDAADPDDVTSTDDSGRWSFAVTASGDYTVTVDAATLPDGQFLKSAQSRTVSVELYNSASALFPLTDDAAAAAGTTAEPAPTDAPPPSEEPPAPEESGASALPSETGANGDPAATAVSAEGFSWPRFWQQAASGVRMGLLLSLAAVGLSIIYGTTGLSNFAHAELISMGGILAYLFMTLTGNIWLAGGIAVVIMAGFGWLQDAVLWKPLRRRRLSLMQLMIVSIGLSIVLQNVFQFFFGANVLRIDRSTPATVTLFGVTLTVQSYVAMAIALVAIVAVGVCLKFTRFGRATRAVSDNPALAEASGIDVNRVVRVVWVVGTALAGLAGVLLGLILNGISWNTGWQFLLLLFAAVVLGGIGTAFGAVIGAMLIGMVVEMANIWLPGDLKHAAALFLLIIVLLVRPQGIFGRRERIG